MFIRLIVRNLQFIWFSFKDPNRLECYYCFGHAGTEHDDCDVDEYGEKVVCQMHDPREPNYGDVCFVGHTGLIIFSLSDFHISTIFINAS